MPWINEFHYDNNGTDTGEFIEIAAAAGTNLSGYSLVLYNGNPSQRTSYQTINLSGVVGDQQNGFGVVSFAAAGLQNGGSGANGEPDGIALVGPGGVVIEFISYEGAFTAANGPAAGMTSTNVGSGVYEDGLQAGTSISRTGTGNQASDFSWVLTAISGSTAGAVNAGQTFQADGSVITVDDISLSEGHTGQTAFTFTLTRSGGTEALTVDYATANGTATAGEDYVAVSGAASFGVGDTEATVTVQVDGDADFEPDETFFLNLSNASSGTIGDAQGEAEIVNDDASPAPLVSIDDVSLSEGDSGQTLATFTVTRTGGSQAFTVDYATGGGTATAGDDYQAASATLDFDAGETSETITVAVNGDTALESNETFNVTLSNATGGASISDGVGVGTIVNDDYRKIYEIQGLGHTSAYAGQGVVTQGVVTAIDKDNNAFWIQDQTGDGDFRTSDGIYVFNSAALSPDIVVGALVQVSGNVSEFRPGSRPDDLTLTEITAPVINVLSTGHTLPGVVTIGDVDDPATNQRTPALVDLGDDETGVYDPVNHGIDFWESLEGMRVTLEDAHVTSAFRSNFGEIYATPDVGANPSLNSRGGLTVSEATPDSTNPADALYDFNPERIQIDDEAGIATPTPTAVGDLLGDVTGVVSSEFGFYDVSPTEAYTLTPSGLEKETTTIEANLDRIRIASFNVENLSPVGTTFSGSQVTTQDKFNGLADAIIDNLGAPEIVTLQELQDNNGTTNDGVVDASVTVTQLINTINLRDGPQYHAVLSSPVDDKDGGAPGGNIQVAYLYRIDSVSPTAGNGLSGAPGDMIRYFATEDRIGADPDGSGPLTEDADFAATRKSLPIEWMAAGYTAAQGGSFWTVGNHLSSKGGSAPLIGDNLDLPLWSEPLNESGVKREGQAIDVHAFIQAVLDGGPATDNRVVALGDFNDFQFFPVLELITGELERLTVGDDDTPSTFQVTGEQILAVLNELLPAEERYSYNFDGNAQALDHILATHNLLEGLLYDIVHMNSEFADQISDHDPSVVSLLMARSAALATDGDDVLDQAAYTAKFGAQHGDLSGDDIVDGLVGNDRLFGYAGADDLRGSGGDDTLQGGAGGDTLSGGGGVGDIADYSDATTAVTVDLALSATQNTGLGVDLLLGVEGLIGAGQNDVLKGADGASFLDGGAGDDTLAGRLGDDTYVVDSLGDEVQEIVGGGRDRVIASVDGYHLGQLLEDLELTGAGDIGGFGNASANLMIGAGGDNELRAGADDDSLLGMGGDDLLVGGLGDDTMEGGQGDDTYVVDSTDDKVAEAADQGRDLVRSSVDWTLGANVEDLILVGGAIEGLGNDLANLILGAGAANRLSGGELDDTIEGGGGADTINGDQGSDRIVGDDGNDSLLGGLDADRLSGGDDADELFGGQGRDRLGGDAGGDHITGGADADLMFGGVGADIFVFLAIEDSAADAKDRVLDFTRADGDGVDVSAIDADGSTVSDDAFVMVSRFTGHAGEARLTYDALRGVSVLRLDLDGDREADFILKLEGEAQQSDFVL